MSLFFFLASGADISLTGSSSISFSSSASLSVEGSVSLAGSSSITVSSSAGPLTRSVALVGSSSITAAASGELSAGSLIGSSSISFSGSGQLSRSVVLTGSASTSFTASGQVSRSLELVASSTFTVTASGELGVVPAPPPGLTRELEAYVVVQFGGEGQLTVTEATGRARNFSSQVDVRVTTLAKLTVDRLGACIFDPKPDFLDIVDCLELVNLRRSMFLPAERVDHAFRRNISIREVEASKGHYRLGDVRWHLDRQEVSTPPDPGAVIIDNDDNEWTLLEVRRDVQDSRWRCVTRNLVVAENLTSPIEIQRNEWTKGAHGEMIPHWVTVAANVRARIQEQSRSSEVVNDRQTSSRDTVIYVNVAIEDNFPGDLRRYRILDANGLVYKILRVDQSDRIDVLPRIHAEVSPSPSA